MKTARGEAMNEEQLAALTEGERGDPDNCECGHSRLRHGNRGKRQCYEWVSEERRCPCRSLTLESATSHRELQAALADARLALTEYREQTGQLLADCEAEVARLTEERDNWRDTADTLGDETHQQREDIRRLVDALEAELCDQSTDGCEPHWPCAPTHALFAEMKERYDA